ncbi:MAG: Stp1/IreP family PP2C-type Ser/Thr phosphatase [Deltaproteobacteria bacterium]|nr:Stp1/IreP family PP2C-type Ser/Thr phosphatase [Deltaproteobacteria bacterium]
MNVIISAAGKTDVGQIRKNNEDSYCADAAAGLFVVADGMGGHASGEVASKMAVDIISGHFRNTSGEKAAPGDEYDAGLSEATNRLCSSIRLANAAVYEAAQKTAEYRGMGTTVASVLINGRQLSIAHIGDSRVYLIRAGNIEQLTDDHSMVYEQVKKALISKEEADKSHNKNILTRALGISDNVEIDLSEMFLADKDILLLCSDGLSNMVDDATMMKVVEATDDPEQACETLVSMANANGGRDNITVIVVYMKKMNLLFSSVCNFFRRFRR